MKRILALALLLAYALLPGVARADGFKVFPGAKLDATLSSQATQASNGMNHVKVYHANASFEKVVAFYKASYKESKKMETPNQAAGSRNATFILAGEDNAMIPSHYLLVKEFGKSVLVYDTAPAH